MWAQARPAFDPLRRAYLRDAILVAIVTLGAWALCAVFNITETLRHLTAPYERYQLDEIPSMLLVLGLGLTWFASRRYGEARQEIARRRVAEAQLAAALADNRRLAQQYVELQEAERKALARELHDELGQYLNVIKLDAVGLRDDQRAAPAAVHHRTSAIVENCNHIHGALATLIRELRPAGLDELGLAAAVEHCVQTWRTRLPDVSLRLSISGDFTTLPESIAVTLYRLVQEALTNVAKHAAAHQVAIRLQRAGDGGAGGERVEVTVAADGVGTAAAIPTCGLGLIGMRERVMALQGELAFGVSGSNTSWLPRSMCRVGEQAADSTLANALSMPALVALQEDEAMSEMRAVAQVVSGWQEHFAGCGVTRGDLALYAEQIDRPFLREQREAASGR